MLEKKLLIYDKNYQTPQQIKTIFAETDYLLDYCQKQQQPLLHFWQTSPTVICGLRDKHLDHLASGLRYLHQENYHLIIRNSGGLAVISDPGVLNVSLLLPHAEDFSIDQGYELMLQLVQACLPNITLTHYEVTNSYCPGSFDLVINHQKFAGIAQRRQHHSLAIMAYISINGNQKKRGQVIQHFYQLANQTHNSAYPQVEPNSMATLRNLTGQDYDVQQFKQLFLQKCQQQATTATLSAQQLQQLPDYTATITTKLSQQQRLNHIIEESLYD